MYKIRTNIYEKCQVSTVFMITKFQRKELEKIKHPKYREKVQAHLLNNGDSFSLETIQKVYSGKRNNLTIAEAIITVFNNYMKEQELLKSKMNAIIKKIKNIP